MIENEGLAPLDSSMLHIRRCFKRLHLESKRSRTDRLLRPCRWFSGSYPDSPVSSPPPQPLGLAATAAEEERKRNTIAPYLVSGHREQQQQQEEEVSEDDIDQARIVWDYMLMHDTLEKSDVILTLGNNDVRVASHAAELWQAGYAKWLLFSGELGNLTKGKWTRPEAEVFRDVALSQGVPNDHILLETRATNTGENIRYAYDVLRARGLEPRRIILVQMPFMERRAYATFMRQWPGAVSQVQVYVTSPPIALTSYPNREVGSLAEIISILLGCLQRIHVYPQKGYQIAQDIPKDVWDAYECLVDKRRYNTFLLGGK